MQGWLPLPGQPPRHDQTVLFRIGDGSCSPNSDRTGALRAFFTLTFAWTWSLWAAPALSADPAGRTATPLLLAPGFGPSLSGFAVVHLFDGPAGLGAWLKRCPGWGIASVVVGTVWGLWHLPLFRIPGMAQANLPMALFMAGSVGLPVVFARLSVKTGFSVLSAILLHAAVNAGSWALPITPQGGELLPYAIRDRLPSGRCLRLSHHTGGQPFAGSRGALSDVSAAASNAVSCWIEQSRPKTDTGDHDAAGWKY